MHTASSRRLVSSTAWCCVVAVCVVSVAHAEPPAPAPTLGAGARIGVVTLLDPEVTHFHAAPKLQDSYLKTYTMDWPVSAMLLSALGPRLAQLGLSPVVLDAGDELLQAREDCFLKAALARGLPKECGSLYARLAAAAHVEALIALGPGLNDSAHAGAARHRDLPQYLRGWCVVSGQGPPGSAPTLLSLTELLLIRVTPEGAKLAARAWGGSPRPPWSNYQPPADLHDIPGRQLDELRPLFTAMLTEQADTLLAHVQVGR